MTHYIQRPEHWKKATGPSRPAILYGTERARGANFFNGDEVLRQLLQRHYPVMLRQQQKRLTEFGAWVAETIAPQADYTDLYGRPELETHDKHGNLVNRVRHNPLFLDCRQELHRRGILWLNYGPQPAPFLLTFSLGYLLSQADVALHMSAALAGTTTWILAHHAPDNLRRHWLPRLLRPDGTGANASLWLSDGDHSNGSGQDSLHGQTHKGELRIGGLKWFAPNPDCDLTLVTASSPDAQNKSRPGLYLVARTLANGKLNRFRIRRLKNTPATRGLAVAEIEMGGCHATEVAPPASCAAIIQRASTYTRIHAAMAGVASQRRALIEGLGVTAQNTPHGKRPTRHPAEQDLLLDIAIDYEADMSLAFAAAASFDRCMRSSTDGDWLRLLAILASHRCTTDAAAAAQLGMQLFGCNGFVDDFSVSRLQRDALGLRLWAGLEIDLATELTVLLRVTPDLKARFGRHMRQIIEQAPLKASRLSSGLRKALANYEELMRFLTRFADAESRVSRHLLPLMADIAAAATLLEDAGYDLERGDARKAMVLDGFLRRHFADHNGLVAVRNAEQLKYFDELISSTAIPVEGDWEKSLRQNL